MMEKSSYLQVVSKLKYKRSDATEEQRMSDLTKYDQTQCMENLHELNERFVKYINRARVLEQRNAVFKKQLETLQRMEEISGLEEAFTEQLIFNRQRLKELCADQSKLERELRHSQSTLDEFWTKYRNECECQEQLRGTLEHLNKEADEALLDNLALQIQLQFLQDDMNATKDRYKKNLKEVQTYVNILQQIVQTTPCAVALTGGLYMQTPGTKGRAAALQNQLEEFKTALCHFQTEKQKMQTEIALLEQTIKSTQESYDDEIQLYNEKIDDLRKELDEMEKILEKHTSVSHRLMMYKQALENEVDRYKQIIDNEGNRLNSAIAGVPVTIFTQSISYSHPPVTRTKDITLAIQDITSAKQRQKSNPKKLSKMMVIVTKEKSVDDNEGNAEIEEDDEGQSKLQAEGEVVERAEAQEEMHPCNEASEDVPDGTQISKVFDTLCSVVKERMRRHRKPEPIVNFFTKGRYVLVTGEASYVDPFFISSSPAGSQVIVNILNGMPTGEGNSQPTIPPPEPFTGKGNEVSKPGHAGDSSGILTEHEGIDENRDKGKTDADKNDNVNHPHETNSHECCQGKNQEDSFKSKSYEKVEVVESIEHVSEHKNRAYEETAMIVETVIEKTRKKKHGGKTA